MKRAYRGMAVALAAAGIFTMSALAKSGEVTIVQCSGAENRTIAMDAQHSFGTGSSIGTVRASPAGGMFDVMTSRCLGAFRSVEGKPSLWGHCEWVDQDGDKILTQFQRNDGLAGTYTVIHGTGKFAGMRGTRPYKITAFPEIPEGRAVCDEGVLQYELP